MADEMRQADGRAGRRPAGGMTVLTLIAVTAALHYGRDVVLPLALAMLIAFALSPVARGLQKRGLPRVPAVLATAFSAFAAVAAFFSVVGAQLAQLADRLPDYQANIMAKLDSLQSSGDGTGLVARLSSLMRQINDRLYGDPDAAPVPGAPMAVEVVERSDPVQVLTSLVVPVISPFATAGIVLVLVVFLLMERAELRDRVIRLVGSNDVHRTTALLEDAGGRVGNYLLMQVLINAIYALPIGFGLWIIGVPNALLWALITLVLRFVPFIGSALAAGLPLILAFAVSPDWSMVLWTAALFIVVELVTSNVVEPWLYGRRIGITPLAIIVAALFWTWVWGPMGLLLATPLTVCLVVLGRHLPQFAVFDVLFGDEPVLAPPARLYERLLAGDAVEVTARAEEALEEVWLSDYWRNVGLPALRLAQVDHARGVLSETQEDRLTDTLRQLTEALEAEALSEAAEDPAPPDGAGQPVLVLGGRSPLDDAAALAVAQVFRAEGAQATAGSHRDLAPARFGAITGSAAVTVLLVYLDPDPPRATLLHIRRIKRAAPHLRVGAMLWGGADEGASAAGAARAIGVDFVAASPEAALRATLSATVAAPLAAQIPRKPRRRLVTAIAQDGTAN
jgi:predicted PurR-regulated permease PerM